MSKETTKELTVTFYAEDFGLPKNIMRTNINDSICSYDAEGKNSDLLGGLLQKFCNNPFGKIISSEKIPEGIKENRSLIKKEIGRVTGNPQIICHPEALLDWIYLEGLTLTFKIETSEILPKTPEVPETSEKIYGKEIKLQKLSTGNIKINDIPITDNIELIQFLYRFLGQEKKIWIKLDTDLIQKITIEDIKKLASEIMFDDIVSEEIFII